jgi:hypothetical protein
MKHNLGNGGIIPASHSSRKTADTYPSSFLPFFASRDSLCDLPFPRHRPSAGSIFEDRSMSRDGHPSSVDTYPGLHDGCAGTISRLFLYEYSTQQLSTLAFGVLREDFGSTATGDTDAIKASNLAMNKTLMRGNVTYQNLNTKCMGDLFQRLMQ